jgi:two-component system, NarL family, nitrate/nitrite response regulator NarL
MVAVQHRHVDGSSRVLECPRIVIADHHDPTRTGLRLALEQDGFIVSGEEATARDAVAAAVREPPDICLLDVDMPGGGITAAEEIRAQLPHTEVVMIGERENGEDLFAALEVGASGYLLKDMNPDRLGPALRDVLDGKAALPRSLTARLIEEFRNRPRQTSLIRRNENDLTAREWDVLDCLRDGLSTRQIADRLFITRTTVRRHVGSILKKLDVESRDEAVELVAQRSRNLIEK